MPEVDDLARELVLDAQGIRPLGDQASVLWHYLHDQESTDIFAGGEAGGSKSFIGCLFDVTEALRLPGTAGAVLRNTAENLRESTIVTYFEVCQKAHLQENVHWVFNETKGLLKWIGGSRTKFDYLKFEARDPNYTRLGGRAYTRAFIDEADGVEVRAVDVLMTRLRYKLTEFCHSCAAPHMAQRSQAVDCDDNGLPNQWECYKCGIWTKGVLPKLLNTGNPGDYWTKTRYVYDEDGKRLKLPRHRKYVHLPREENPDKAFVASYNKQLDDMEDEYDKARLRDGDWNAVRRSGREFMYAFHTAKHVPKGPDRVAYDPSLPLHITWDFNTAPYITLLVAQIHLNTHNRFHVAFLREFCLKHPESNPTAACGALLHAMEPGGAFPDHKAGIFYYGDASGKNSDLNQRDGIRHSFDTIRKELRTHLHNSSDRVIFRNPSHAVVRDFQNSAFKGDRRFYMSFDPSMTNTIADHLNVKEGADGKILKVYETDRTTGVRYEKWGHCVQATYYMTCGAFPDEFKTFIRR
jgi:phage terminase large subunit